MIPPILWPLTFGLLSSNGQQLTDLRGASVTSVQLLLQISGFE